MQRSSAAYGSTLEDAPAGGRVQTDRGTAEAESAVVALGAWADVVADRLGYRLPVAAKRGYHMPYKPEGGASPNHPTPSRGGGQCATPLPPTRRVAIFWHP